MKTQTPVAKTWKSSTQPRKQRKYRANVPLHARVSLVAVHLAKELRTSLGKRAIPVRKGDKVKICRGQFKGKIGKVERVDLKELLVYVSGAETLRKEGGKSLYPLQPSNLIILEASLDDKQRKESVERKVGKQASPKPAAKPAAKK